MVDKIDYRGVVNPVPGVSETEQRELVAKYEPSEIYTLGRDAAPDDVIKQTRPPRAVVVSDLALLAEPRGNKAARTDSFVWLKTEIHRKGGFVVEARTGRRSNRPKDWLAMRQDAERMCGRMAQGAKSALNAKRGAKPWIGTKAENEAIREEWYTKPGRTVDDAVKAIKRRLGKRAPGRTVIYREFDVPVMKKR